MKMRSWIAFVMPMTLTGLHALSVEMPTTVSTDGSIRGRRGRCSPRPDVGAHRLAGKYSQVGTCFIAAA